MAKNSGEYIGASLTKNWSLEDSDPTAGLNENFLGTSFCTWIDVDGEEYKPSLVLFKANLTMCYMKPTPKSDGTNCNRV